MKTNEPKTHRNPQVAQLREALSQRAVSRGIKSMQLAAKIEDAILDNGLTKKEFAGLVNVQPSVVTKWLSGTHNFTIETLFDIEECLRIELVSIDSAMTGIHLKMTMVISGSEPLPVSPKPFWDNVQFNGTGVQIENNSLGLHELVSVFNTIRGSNLTCDNFNFNIPPKARGYDR